MSILIVEDNDKNRMLMRDVLAFKGYRLAEAEPGEDGVRLARELHPDLILMDIQLPGINGITAFRQIRDDPATAMIPAIAVTASAMTQDRKTIMAAGFPRLEPRSLQSQEPYRHDLRTMNSSPAVLPVLCDEICDELRREMARESTDGRQRDRVCATGRSISRFRTISSPVRTALRCDAPQVHRRYADRASPRPNSSSANNCRGVVHGRDR